MQEGSVSTQTLMFICARRWDWSTERDTAVRHEARKWVYHRKLNLS